MSHDDLGKQNLRQPFLDDSHEKKSSNTDRGPYVDQPSIAESRAESIAHRTHREELEKNENEISLLTKVSIVCILFMVTEIVGGIISGSLAILTDAAHLLSDLVGFAVSIFALTIGARAPTNTLTFGYYRAETVGALTSVILIWALTIWLIYEAIVRIIKPPPVKGGIMLIIACIGLFANLLMMHMLKGSKTQGHQGHGAGGHDDDHGGDHDKGKKGGKKDHDDDSDGDDHNAAKAKKQGQNLKAAYIHVLQSRKGSLINSVGVIIAGVIIYIKQPDWSIVDPLCTFVFSIIVMCTTKQTVKTAINIIMEATPEDVEVEKIRAGLEKLPGVAKKRDARKDSRTGRKVRGVSGVHDLHIWALKDGKNVMSCHINTDEPRRVLTEARAFCKANKIHHFTLQFEGLSDPCMADVLMQHD